MFEKMYNLAERNNAEITICSARKVNESGEITESRNPNFPINLDLLPVKQVFNYKIYPEQIFGILGSIVWNKLYLKDFLLKNSIKFPNFVESEDLFFSCASGACADKIIGLDDELINYRFNREGSIQTYRADYASDVIKSALLLKEFLKQRNRFQELKSAWLNTYTSSFRWEVALCNDNQYKNFIEQLQLLMPEDWQIFAPALRDSVTMEKLNQFIGDKKVMLWGASYYLRNLLENEKDPNPNIIGILKTKGFIEKDRKFTVGNISSLMTNGIDNYFLLCKLFIGNSLSIKEEKKAKESNSIDKKIAPYFNSYKILTSDNMVLQIDRKDFNDIKDKSFIYDLLKPKDICPLYVVKVQTITDTQQRNNDNYFCSRCLQKEAEVFCLHCEDYFDLECYNTKHKPKNQKELNHGNYQKIQHKQKEGICAEHEDREAAYYCLVCKKPICSVCKIKVLKNDKESIHYLHPVKDIYQAFEEELPNTYLSAEIRKRAVKQFKSIKDIVKALIEKQIMIEKEIEHEFRDENDMIQSLTKEAKLKHFSVSAELNEMKKHLTNMDSYYSKCFKAMKEAKLKPEAFWIKDNYEEVINIL